MKTTCTASASAARGQAPDAKPADKQAFDEGFARLLKELKANATDAGSKQAQADVPPPTLVGGGTGDTNGAIRVGVCGDARDQPLKADWDRSGEHPHRFDGLLPSGSHRLRRVISSRPIRPAAGLLAPTARSVRPLFPALIAPADAPSLTDTEQARLVALREQAARKRRAATLPGEAGLTQEARPPLLDAVHLHARALAVEHRLPEPADLAAALLPPLALFFGEDLFVLRGFATGAVGDWQAAAKVLARTLKKIPPA